MRNLKLTLAYDGTDFRGWQSQARERGGRTVQDAVESALARLAGGARVAVVGAGRTDSGVHAEGQVASFDLPREMDPVDLARSLNGLLPLDVRVLDASSPPEGFHARRSAVSKVYRYALDIGPAQLPTRRRTAGHVPWDLDPEPVNLVVGHSPDAVCSAPATAGLRDLRLVPDEHPAA